MTKCNVLPRGLGTFPAGSAVRVKSRFALYSPRGAPFRARVGVRFADVLVVRFAVVVAPRFAVVLALRFALFAAPRFAADFLADVGRVLLTVRLVAMRRPICQEHAGE